MDEFAKVMANYDLETLEVEYMEKTYKVTGMHCASCEMLIKESLEDAGVKVLDISAKKNMVKVDFDDKKINEIKIKTIIEGEGYKVV